MPRQRKKPEERKRIRGEGTRWQISENRWRGQLTRRRDPITGKTIRPSVEAETELEVIDKLNQKRVELSGRMVSVTSRSSLSSYLLSWLEVKRLSVRPRTGQRYGENLIPIMEVIGHIRLEELTAPDVNRCVAELSRRRAPDGQLRWKPPTINRMREVLRNALNDAIGDRELSYNAADFAKPLKVVDHHPVVIGDAETMGRFLVVAEGEQFQIIARPHIVALLTGLRVGEICGLRWADVRGSTITVNRQIQRIRKSIVEMLPLSYERWGGLVAMEPKTEKSQRSIDVPRKVIEILDAQRQTQEAWRTANSSRWQENDLIFTTRHGTPIDPGELLGQLQRILAEAGMRRMRFHDLRHSLVVLLSVQDIPPSAILRITGWSNISQLQRYSQYTPAMGEQAVRAIDSVLEASRQT